MPPGPASGPQSPGLKPETKGPAHSHNFRVSGAAEPRLTSDGEAGSERRDVSELSAVDSKQPKINANEGVHRVDKVRIINLHIVDVVADGMTDHFRRGEGRQQILYRSSGIVSEP